MLWKKEFKLMWIYSKSSHLQFPYVLNSHLQNAFNFINGKTMIFTHLHCIYNFHPCWLHCTDFVSFVCAECCGPLAPPKGPLKLNLNLNRCSHWTSVLYCALRTFKQNMPTRMFQNLKVREKKKTLKILILSSNGNVSSYRFNPLKWIKLGHTSKMIFFL